MFERSGLHDLDPTLPEDDWPLLELTDVTVYVPGRTDELVDIFDVAEKGPFKVKGRLQKLKGGAKGIERTQSVYTHLLTIPKVYTYSIEQLADEDDLKIWILGKAGWYHIKPSREYEALYAEGMEKAKLWTFLENMYLDLLESRKKIAGTLDEIVNRYYEEHQSPTSCPDVGSARWLFEKYHRFLIVKLLENEGGGWARTPIYRFCASHYPLEVKELRDTLKWQRERYEQARQVESPAPPSGSTVSTTRSPAPAPGTTPSGSVRRRQQLRVKVETPEKTPTRPRPHARSRSRKIYRFLEDYICIHDIPAREITLRKLAEVFYENFELFSAELAQSILVARASDLLVLMEESREYQWEIRKAYMQLQKSTPPNNAKALWAMECRQRTDMPIRNSISVLATGQSPPPRSLPQPECKTAHPNTGGKGHESVRIKRERSSVSPSFEDYYEDTPPEPSSYSTKGKGKSALRPAGPAIPRVPSSPLAPPNDDDDAGDDGSLSIRFANLKRTLDGLSKSAPAAKRPRTASSPVASDFEAAPSPHMDLDWPEVWPGRGKPPITVTQLPDTTHIVGGIWRCQMEGCVFKVLDAETPEGIVDIEMHYEEHGQKMRNVMDVIGIESIPSKGRQVDNLLAKLEDMAKQWSESKPIPSLDMMAAFRS